MTIKEHFDKHGCHGFMFTENIGCFIKNGKVYMEQHLEGGEELKHIKTIEDYKALYKLLTGKELK